jgi:hypothetical protein
MNRKATQQEAQKLINEFGAAARAKAEEAAHEAHRKRDMRRTKCFTNVVRYIQKKNGLEEILQRNLKLLLRLLLVRDDPPQLVWQSHLNRGPLATPR